MQANPNPAKSDITGALLHDQLRHVRLRGSVMAQSSAPPPSASPCRSVYLCRASWRICNSSIREKLWTNGNFPLSFIASAGEPALRTISANFARCSIVARLPFRQDTTKLITHVGLSLDGGGKTSRAAPWFVFKSSIDASICWCNSDDIPSQRTPIRHRRRIASPLERRRFSNIHSSIASNSVGDIIVTTRKSLSSSAKISLIGKLVNFAKID